MYEAFESLNEEKKNRIIEGCIDEFSKYGYENSSTNRIVNKVGISKGSLFNYFNKKEDLYFYILDYTIGIITDEMFDKLDELPDDLFEKVYKIAELEYDIYVHRPKIYYLFKKALTSNDKELTKKIQKRYSLKTNNVFGQLLGDFNTDNLKWKKDKIINVIKWVLEGLNNKFLTNLDEDIKTTKSEYLKELSLYIDILKEGMV